MDGITDWMEREFEEALENDEGQKPGVQSMSPKNSGMTERLSHNSLLLQEVSCYLSNGNGNTYCCGAPLRVIIYKSTCRWDEPQALQICTLQGLRFLLKIFRGAVC